MLNNGKLLERREIELVTAFPGPGGRDAFEMVTRCVTDGRLHVDKDLPEAAGIMESPHRINKKIFLIELTWKKLHGILVQLPLPKQIDENNNTTTATEINNEI